MTKRFTFMDNLPPLKLPIKRLRCLSGESSSCVGQFRTTIDTRVCALCRVFEDGKHSYNYGHYVDPARSKKEGSQ